MSGPAGQTYTRYQLCDELEPKQRCFRLRRRNGLEFEDLFHEHVPRHRISEDRALAAMKALIFSNQKAPDWQILHSYLNERGSAPPKFDRLPIHIDYPEPGVMRTHCGTEISVWMDHVIAPWDFRKETME